jgi:hypothetical protein
LKSQKSSVRSDRRCRTVARGPVWKVKGEKLERIG